VLKRSERIDRILGAFLRAYPTVPLCEAIEELSAQGW
jgi:hypothetical protein